MRGWLAAIGLAGCSFSAELPDKPPVECAFDFTPDYLDPCTLTTPGALLDVTVTDDTSIDTDNGTLVGPNVVTPPPTTIVDGVRVMWTRSFTITTSGRVRAYGERPLVIIAMTTMRIDGSIDASSTTFSKGAGANPLACNEAAFAAAAGQQCANHGGSGGGGGGFGAPGGNGGEGGNTRMCDGMDGKPGGIGGKAVALPTELRGGCPGGNGSRSDNATSAPGIGGFGGGAIALLAAERIVVAGVVHAGGAGGGPGVERAGGGGGGAGGMIVLESSVVDLAGASVLAANGGGGAGGCDGGVALAGEHGLPGVEGANGGDPDGSSGAGGDGGVRVARDGQPGLIGDRGGGGGGGGVGVIVVHGPGMREGMTSPQPVE